MRTDGGRRRVRAGQALMEVAAGMLTLALVASVICGFAHYIARSLAVQNSLRGDARLSNGRVEGSAVWLGAGVSENLRVEERCEMPSRVILR